MPECQVIGYVRVGLQHVLSRLWSLICNLDRFLVLCVYSPVLLLLYFIFINNLLIKCSKPCKTHRWIKNVATQNVFKRNNGFPRDIDVFAHMGRCRIIPSRVRNFTNGSEQRGLSEITANSSTSNIKSDGQLYKHA